MIEVYSYHSLEARWLLMKLVIIRTFILYITYNVAEGGY